MSNQVIILHIWPGMTVSQLKMMLSDPETKGVVMYTYGAGNFPIVQEMLDVLKEAIKLGLVRNLRPDAAQKHDLTRSSLTDRGQRLSVRSRQGPSAVYVCLKARISVPPGTHLLVRRHHRRGPQRDRSRGRQRHDARMRLCETLLPPRTGASLARSQEAVAGHVDGRRDGFGGDMIDGDHRLHKRCIWVSFVRRIGTTPKYDSCYIGAPPRP